VAKAALTAGLSPVMVVTGSKSEQVETALTDLPVIIVHNKEWQSGQGSSIRTGLGALYPSLYPAAGHFPIRYPVKNRKLINGEGMIEVGAAIFLLADQPQVTPTILRALIEEHTRNLSPIVAPLVDGQRSNPVLFDRLTFPDLLALNGDIGGRSLFSKYQVSYLPWQDESLLSDVDTPEDYRKLIHGE
jgi:molybdenum cofactor cytidylyltransferase